MPNVMVALPNRDLFSSLNLRGRTLDVYHTSTHGVALVRIHNAGLKRAAHGSLEMLLSLADAHYLTAVQ